MSNSQEQTTVNPVLAEQSEGTPRSLSPRTQIRTQPQMIRSNSSSGVTTFHASHPPSSPTASKFGKNRHLTRNASAGSGEAGLKTFRVAQSQSSFRGGSPSRATQPSLANLEFPPPPTDLPPPPEEFDGSFDGVDGVSHFLSENRRKILPVSPIISKRSVGEAEIDTSDVRNLEPSVEEASSRFGVSLKKRDVSTDSCSSVKDNKDEKSPQQSSISLSPSQEGRSPVSVNSDVPVVGSPLEPLPSSNSVHSEHGMYLFCS